VRSARSWAVVGVALLSVLTSACSGDEAADSSASSPTQQSVDCSGVPRPGTAIDPQAVACADNGFEPANDEFSFPNWGDTGALDATAMVAMFGPDAVCAQQGPDGCVLFPAAHSWLTQVNEAMEGGRCEGMAVLSAQLADGGPQVAELQPGADATVELLQATDPVVEQIEYLWATQLPAEVAEPTAETRNQPPSAIVQILIEGLRNGDGYTLGMYYDGAGHAVTPFAVSLADGIYDIAIYDNNYPGEVSHLLVDPAEEAWFYQDAAINPDEASETWSGIGPGSLDLTAMQWRAGPFTAPFDETAERGSLARTFLVTADLAPTSGSVGAKVQIGSEEFDTATDAAGLQTQVPGSLVTFVRSGGTVVGVQVTIPASVGDVSVSPTLNGYGPNSGQSSPESRTRVRVSVDAPNQPRVTVASAMQTGQPAFTMSSQQSGALSISAAAGARATTTIDNQRRSFTLPLPSGGSINVSASDGGEVTVVLADESGEEYEYVLEDGSDSDEVIDIIAEFQDGEWEVSEEVLEPVELEETLDQELGEVTDQDQVDAEDSATSNGSGDEEDVADTGGTADTGEADSNSGSEDSSGNDEPSGDTSDNSGANDSGANDSGANDTGGPDPGPGGGSEE